MLQGNFIAIVEDPSQPRSRIFTQCPCDTFFLRLRFHALTVIVIYLGFPPISSTL